MLEITDSTKFDAYELKIRIGINAGNLIAGSVGGGGRQNYTVHGDCVNVAARLEALNKEFHTRLLVSESVSTAAKGSFSFWEVAKTPIRGRMGQMYVYTTDAQDTSHVPRSSKDSQSPPVC